MGREEGRNPQKEEEEDWTCGKNQLHKDCEMEEGDETTTTSQDEIHGMVSGHGEEGDDDVTTMLLAPLAERRRPTPAFINARPRRMTTKQILLRAFVGVTVVLPLCVLILFNILNLPFYAPWMLPMTSTSYDRDVCMHHNNNDNDQSGENDAHNVGTVVEDAACHGMEMAPALQKLIGFRGLKVAADPSLFLAPHLAMESVLLALLVAALIVPGAMEAIETTVFFPLAAVFALHTLPTLMHFHGISETTSTAPGSGSGSGSRGIMVSMHMMMPTKLHLVCVIIAAAVTGEVTTGLTTRMRSTKVGVGGTVSEVGRIMRRIALVTSGVAIALAPAIDFGIVMRACVASSKAYGGYDHASKRWISPGGDVPSPQSGRGFYASIPPPWSWIIGWSFVLAFVSTCIVRCHRFFRARRRARAARSRAISKIYASEEDDDIDDDDADDDLVDDHVYLTSNFDVFIDATKTRLL